MYWIFRFFKDMKISHKHGVIDTIHLDLSNLRLEHLKATRCAAMEFVNICNDELIRRYPVDNS